jgi:hypothetical protein
MKILILGAAPLPDDGDAPPIWLAEHSGEILVQRFVRALEGLRGHLVFAMREEDVRRYRLDSVITQAAPGAALVSIRGVTAGAACTALFCIHHIVLDQELLIMSGNELVDIDYSDIITSFRTRQLDAGVLIFNALHPRYSYVRLDDDNLVVEAAEKNPISHHAMAGFTWFRCGADFIEAAKAMIRKDVQVQGSFFISLTLNEMVLQQKRIGVMAIETRQYRPLKSRRQVLDYEADPIERGVS